MSTERRPDIVYIMSDQHARKVAGCYGDTVVATPHLDALARQGVVFDNGYCPSPICVPSRMSAFTGQWPFEQQCWTLQDHLGTDRPTWMHALGAADYRPTLVGRMHAVGPDQHHGFAERIGAEPGPHWPGVPRQDLGVLAGAQGPARVSVERSGRGQSAYQLADEEVARDAAQWLDGVGRRRRAGDAEPFCLMVGFTLPHCPFVARGEDFDAYDGRVGPPEHPPPDPSREHPWLAKWRAACGIATLEPADVLRARTAYYGLVARTDALVGQVLAALDRNGLRQNTLIVYTSDHGEQIGERGLWWKNTFYEESAGVPLIVSWPGHLPHNERRGHVVNLIDIGATLIDAAGAPGLPASHGRSLLGIARDPAAPWENVTFSEYVTDTAAAWTGPEATRQRMIRSDRYKLVVIDGYPSMLFDLEDDPAERRDLAGDPAHAGIREDLEARVFANWDPRAIEAIVARRQQEKTILHRWAARTRPPLHFVRPLDPAESWLDDRPRANA
ncbi:MULTISPECIES: sulfatase-like hydrolase/transferase [unclassified Roseitalea]|uniref:sulfatase-like hydrolase/transferase n=1 Tax=unclassified Roseitalea TaxID=2639107 RepID=UPI00273FFECE|nr:MULTISPECIES: sulfatase-like hydrolase/transferase [unclassified Roseitalea]